MHYFIIFLTVFFYSHYNIANEVDNYTFRYQPLNDSLEALNEKTNFELNSAAKSTNQKKGCNNKLLYKEIKNRLGGHLFGRLELWTESSPQIDKIYTKRTESVYQDFNFFESYPQYFIPMSPIIKINGTIIGSDKFGHFFEEGWDYFKIVYIKKRGLHYALRYGDYTEMGLFGSGTTGIYSYADLTANYNGMRFWANLVEETAPPGEHLFECENNRFVQVKNLDWKEYIDAAWDESINCSEFNSSAMEKKVKNRIVELQKRSKNNYTCPADKKLCKDIREKYQEHLLWLISPQCFKLKIN